MKQHRLCTDSEHKPDILNLPISGALKSEWTTTGTRRQFLGRSGKVLGWAALASLLGDATAPRILRADNGKARQPSPAQNDLLLPHFRPKATRAIYLFMSGGPSQVDLLDYKPNLAALYNKDIPDSVRGISS